MGTKPSEFLISSSYQGRDKSLVKSMLNIDNQYGGLIIKYTDDFSLGSVVLDKDSTSYYIFFKENNSKIMLGKSLNPKVIIEAFNKIGSLEETKVEVVENNILLTELQKCFNSCSKDLMIIRDKDIGIEFVLDNRNNQIHSRINFSDDIIKGLINTNKKIYIAEITEFNDTEFLHSMPLSIFKWNCGFLVATDLFCFGYKSNGFLIKSISWPDYGNLSYVDEFIQLSSLLISNQLTYQELIEQTGLQEKILNSFLNAALLSNHVELIENNCERNGGGKAKKSSFLTALKSLFSK